MKEPKCKQYTIQVNLPEEDALCFAKKAGAYGLTVGQLIENFIADLICGEFSNGSDERMYAHLWFDRCGFSMFPDRTFLHYLIECGMVKEMLSLWADLQEAKSDIAYYEKKPDRAEPGEVEETMEYLQAIQEQIDQHWNRYCQMKTESPKGTLEEEMEKVLAWQEEWQRWNN